MKRLVSGIMLTLLLTSMLTLAFNVRPVRSDYFWTETIYVQADGSIQPPTAPISSVDNVTYTLTDNITGNVPPDSSAIIIQRDNIIIDGAGYTLQSTWAYETRGIELTGRSNVTIKNMKITVFYRGIWLESSSNNSVSGNDVTANIWLGIYLESSCNNSVSGNSITANYWMGLALEYSSNNSVSGNNITNNGVGISLGDSSNNNSVSGNNITANTASGIQLAFSSNYNSVSGNTVAKNMYGIYPYNSSNNRIYHNDFINNTQQVARQLFPGYASLWDDGYPSGGNYWSNYTGMDANGDGIGDSPHFIDIDNQDDYPLMNPWAPPDIAVVNLTASKTVVGEGFSLSINLTVENQGNKVETFNISVCANTTLIKSQVLSLASGNSTILTFEWNTAGFVKGNYTISAVVDVLPDEADLLDNALTDGTVTVTIPGDVTGDIWVDMLDINLLTDAFLSYPGHPLWNPSTDINNDNSVDMLDISIAIDHFMQP